MLFVPLLPLRVVVANLKVSLLRLHRGSFFGLALPASEELAQIFSKKYYFARSVFTVKMDQSTDKSKDEPSVHWQKKLETGKDFKAYRQWLVKSRFTFQEM